MGQYVCIFGTYVNFAKTTWRNWQILKTFAKTLKTFRFCIKTHHAPKILAHMEPEPVIKNYAHRINF